MKTIATLFTWLLIVYLCAYVLLNMKYTFPADFPPPQQGSAPLRKLKSHSSFYDGVFYSDTLNVQQPGDPWLDLFGIHTFRVIDRDGEYIDVYQDRAIQNPNKNSVVLVTGVFKLLENDTYTQEVCLFASQVEELDAEAPAVKKFMQKVIKNPKLVKAQPR